MKVWIIKLGENLSPLDGPRERPNRAISVARTLAKQGHEVSYWTSSMSHYAKRERSRKTLFVTDDWGVALNVLWAPPYYKNVSLRRILHHYLASRAFSRLAPSLAPPDVILSSYPTAEMCLAAANFARPRKIPVLLDVRDMWPDIFLEFAPQFLQWGARSMLQPFFAQTRRCLRPADAIGGITDEMVKWALKRAGRAQTPKDRAFHLAYYSETVRPDSLREAHAFWDQILPPSSLTLVFIGSFARRCELDTLVKAAERIPPAKQVTFVLAGTGERADEIRKASSENNRIVLPGWIDGPKIRALLDRADCGLLPYPSTQDFMISLPNKVGEYLSAGLPILSSARGVMENFLRENMCGWTYPNNNPERLAELIIDIEARPDRLLKARERAKVAFRDKFDAAQVYGNMAHWILQFAIQRG